MPLIKRINADWFSAWDYRISRAERQSYLRSGDPAGFSMPESSTIWHIAAMLTEAHPELQVYTPAGDEKEKPARPIP